MVTSCVREDEIDNDEWTVHDGFVRALHAYCLRLRQNPKWKAFPPKRKYLFPEKDCTYELLQPLQAFLARSRSVLERTSFLLRSEGVLHHRKACGGEDRSAKQVCPGCFTFRVESYRDLALNVSPVLLTVPFTNKPKLSSDQQPHYTYATPCK